MGQTNQLADRDMEQPRTRLSRVFVLFFVQLMVVSAVYIHIQVECFNN
jgi:hypothetical protein